MPTQPVDPRARRSRTALETALRELLADRPMAQIAISDVTKRAGVNRSTFYEHYTDLADLTAAACAAVFEELVATSALRQATGQRPDNPLPRLFSHVGEHAHLYRTLLGPDGSAQVINHLLDRIAAAAHDRRGGPATPDPTAVFLAGAVLNAVIDWLRRDCPGTPEQLGQTYWPYLLAAATATP